MRPGLMCPANEHSITRPSIGSCWPTIDWILAGLYANTIKIKAVAPCDLHRPEVCDRCYGSFFVNDCDTAALMLGGVQGQICKSN
jgi:hypothetical protein